MATFFDTNGVNLTSFGGNRLEKNTVAITLSSNRVEVIGDGVDGETYSVSSYSIPITQLELGKDASGNYLNGCIKSFYYYPVDIPSAQLKALSTRRETKQLPPASQPNFVFAVRIPTANTTWNLRSAGTVNYDVDWGDGQTEIVQTSNTKAHTYTTPGNYTVVVTIRSGVFRPFFNNTTDAARITSIISTGTNWDFGTNLASAFYGGSSVVNMENIYTSNVTDMSNAWRGFSSLLSFPFLDTPSVTTVSQAWLGCSSLTIFPPLNLAAVTNFSFAWQNCSSLVNFPFINTSSGTNFQSAWQNCNKLTSFPLINTAAGTNFVDAWNGCSRLTSFPLINTAAGTSFANAWNSCSSLTSFPLINTAASTTFFRTWQFCSELTSFPLINTAACTNFQQSWQNLSKLTSFPLINTSNGTTFETTWMGCTGLTSFPLIDTSSGINFTQSWRDCRSLTTFPALNFNAATGAPTNTGNTGFLDTWNGCTNLANFPANVFNTTSCTRYTGAFSSCALTAQSIENILVSINTANTSNGNLSLNGGTNAIKSTWTTAANTAYDALIGRGWTITFRS